jgi:hypothetical protein
MDGADGSVAASIIRSKLHTGAPDDKVVVVRE